MATPLTWVSTPFLGQGRAGGGSAAAELFEGGGSQRRRSLLETLVREICQNSTDQRSDTGPALVSFDLLLLRGKRREAFLTAMDWEGLRPHLAAVPGSGGAAMTLRAGLAAVEAETLVCLRISDSGTRGLCGDDWDEEGNFRRLCVQNFSTGEEAGRGGSFGLGKAVSWMHSRLLTVLFSSCVSDRPERGLRIFGRSEVPAHELSGQRFLDGAYLGDPSERDGIPVALSDWRPAPEARDLCLSREDLPGLGTTLLIPAFHEPDRDDVGHLGIRDPEHLCRDLTEAAAKWFWPAISWGRLEVQARVIECDRQRPMFQSRAEIGHLWSPFLAATRAEPDRGPALVPGESAATDISGFPLPARIQPEDRPDLLHGRGNTVVRVAATRVPPAEAVLPSRSCVALIRGAGMVVDYVEGLRLPDGGAYCAVALVGTALAQADVPSSKATESQTYPPQDVEEYFRAAEPVTHDDWIPTTRRLRESYDWRGSAGRLRGLRSEVRQLVVLHLLTADEPAPDAGPEMLMRMLNLGGSAAGSDPLTARGEKPRLEVRIDRGGSWYDPGRGGWSLQGELIRCGKGEGGASAGLSFRSIADSGQGESWCISDLEIQGSDRHLSLDSSDGRRIVFCSEGGFSSVPFRCMVRPPAGVDPALTGFRQGG
ncbi:MAG: hypothetical protein WBN89_01485 [Prochlorococcaceae cyanobacterium]